MTGGEEGEEDEGSSEDQAVKIESIEKTDNLRAHSGQDFDEQGLNDAPPQDAQVVPLQLRSEELKHRDTKQEVFCTPHIHHMFTCRH